MNRNLLVDWIPFDVPRNMLNESIKSGKVLEVKGVLQRADAKNHNGRVYPKVILERESESYNENFIKQNRAYGELDHPDSSVIELKNACHMVTEMHWEGNDLVGTCKILSTPAGNILKEIFSCGGTLGISSRGLGSVKELHEHDGPVVMVQEDFELIGFDFVSNPSTHGAFMAPTPSGLNESIIKECKTLSKTPNIYYNAETLIRDILVGIDE
jgi:hypothetical protein